jgi:hypothetical protein
MHIPRKAVALVVIERGSMVEMSDWKFASLPGDPDNEKCSSGSNIERH